MAERGNALLRRLDTRAGTPLLRTLSLMRRRRPLPDAPRRIGVLCVGALGDLLLLSAVVEDLKAAHPDARVVLLGSATNSAIAPLLPHQDFVTLPVTRPDKALAALRDLKLDVLIDTTQWARLPALLSALSGAHCVGFQTAGHPRHHCYDQVVEHRNDRHEIENFRALVSTIAQTTDRRPELALSDADRQTVKGLDLGRYSVFHAWPSGINSHLKEWPKASWAETAKVMAAHDVRVVLTGAPVDAENSAALAAHLQPHAEVIDLAGKLRLSETAALLESAVCVLSVNTGIMHMAATFDVPLIALSGPTNPVRWGPLSPKAVNVAPSLKGCGYLNLGFEYPDAPPDCMGAISSDAVADALADILT